MTEASDVRTAVSSAVLAIIKVVMTFLGLAIHLWTVVLVFRFGAGLFRAALAFFLPVIAEIAVGAAFWNTVGFFNPYRLALLAYVGLWLASWLGFLLLAVSER